MRREIKLLILLFLVLFSSVSLFSFSPDDPSVHHVGHSGEIHNFFGFLGAHLAGFLIVLFGIGAFWVPVVLLIACLSFLKHRSVQSLMETISGGTLLMVSTAALAAFYRETHDFFGSHYFSGGIIGLPIQALLLKYANWTGGAAIAALFFLIGLILTTGISLIITLKNLGKLVMFIFLALGGAMGRLSRWRFRRPLPQPPTPLILNPAVRKNKVMALTPPVPVNTANPEIQQGEESKPKPKPAPKPDPEPVEFVPPPVLLAPPTTKTSEKPDPGPPVTPPAANTEKQRLEKEKEKDRERQREKENEKNKDKDKDKDIVIQRTMPQDPPRKAAAPRNTAAAPFPPPALSGEGFRLPSLEFLNDAEISPDSVDHEHLMFLSRLLVQKLADFGVRGKVVTVLPGPVITRFEFEPAPGIKINKVVNLTDDLALALSAISIRIIAPIPGKGVIGIEVPNDHREIVVFKDIVASQAFLKSKSKLTLGMGKDIVGHPVTANLDEMPHLLIAGATGTGKSVALNTMICSLLYKSTPDEVKLIMVDPKRIELSVYDGIPSLICPVVTDMKKATNALFWAVREMERRYILLSENRVRNIKQYNRKAEKENEDWTVDSDQPYKEILPYIVIIIDELADLMMVGSRDVEVGLTRLAQMARASGIHLILATQRPSVDVLTGIIKANFPTRLSFQVSSKTDSRTIIDSNGAETLLGNGDMLFLPPGTAKLQRIHGAYISEEEIAKIIEFLKAQKAPEYDHHILESQEKNGGGDDEKDYDERYDEAVALVTKTGQASISMIQRHLRIGYNRAARIIEIMEQEGVVGPSDGVKPREVLARNYDDVE